MHAIEKTAEDADGGFNVGERLRMVRHQHGLSQRALAMKAGVTHSLVSLIEKNKVSPSVASLKKILESISYPLTDFFALTLPPVDQIFYRADELVPLSTGTLTLLQVGDAKSHSVQIFHEFYEPGADSGETMLQHDAEEGGVVVAGELELTVGGQTRILRKGDAYLFDSRLPHRYRNVGTERCEVVSACTPPYL
ncbi:transcriptional regulator with XRE-family HTH domain [Rhizobium petrolearium]|uniref:cupin domain-containing protein n=1 Tax=Neorhizobium petrolearium TaxID=515361 RepID=UPI001AE59055|nr:cupin domain-containing protein [Neorhizobium petrolearium]MBP1842597.1 transcriptional regulator with XRE-family HTH domain [Neorhizobium petrolearium]